jgi:hypothetical protein
MLDLPANWREIGRGSPTIHRLVDGQGKARLFVFCRDENRTTFLVGDFGGRWQATWSELRPIGLAEPEAGPITGWTAPITILEATATDGRRKHLMWYERSRDGKPSRRHLAERQLRRRPDLGRIQAGGRQSRQLRAGLRPLAGRQTIAAAHPRAAAAN